MADVVLEPKLTRFDLRVLKALASWPDDWVERYARAGEYPPWRSAWTVAESLREYDVAMVAGVLRGLTHLGYASSRGWQHTQLWMRDHEGRADDAIQPRRNQASP